MGAAGGATQLNLARSAEEKVEHREPRSTRDEAVARATVYQFLSRCFLYPDSILATWLEDSAYREQVGEFLRSLTPDASPTDRISALAARNPALSEEFVRLFGHVDSSGCPPCETRYGGREVFRQTQELADIAGFYRAFGLEVSGRGAERLDHITVELEFMHYLTFKEAYALTHHGEDKAHICREAQETFLREHLGCWVPTFCRLLAKAAGGGFYHTLAALTEQFIGSECCRLGIAVSAWEEEDLMPVNFAPEGSNFLGPAERGGEGNVL